MNDDGFGKKEFIILIAVMFMCFAIITGLCNSTFKSSLSSKTIDTKEKTYSKKLDKLLIACERYQNDNYSTNIDKNTTIIFTYTFLKKEKYVKKITDNGKECNGYVVFKQENAKISYKPYLKCGNNYKTSGYNKNNEI